MATKQYLALFEHISGFALFRVKEFDEIIRDFTAHVNAFIKPIAFLHFKSVDEAVENVQAIADGRVSSLLVQFLRANIPPRDCSLGVNDEKLGKAILLCDFGFDCVWHGGVHEVLRVIRQNFTRLIRSLVMQPGAASLLSKNRIVSRDNELTSSRVVESRSRLIIGLTRARLQLNLPHHLTDSAIIKVLALIDDLDTHLVRSTSRLRACYSLHFPEVCQFQFDKTIYLKDIHLLKLISECPMRPMLKSAFESGLLSSCFNDSNLAKGVALAAQDSIGSELNPEDCENLQKFAERLLSLMQGRQAHIDSLSRRINKLCPNLYALLDESLDNSKNCDCADFKVGHSISACLVAARLIANAGSLSRLASMPSTRVLSLGASKSLFRKSGAVAATSTGLLSSVSKSLKTDLSQSSDLLPPKNEHHAISSTELKFLSANRIQPDVVRRRAARLLAAKSSLACRADYFRHHNPICPKDYNAEVNQSNNHDDADIRLETGLYGKHLGKTVREGLRIWAECNGVHVDRTPEQIKIQRDRRKKYRKNKRKTWLLRKLDRGLASTVCNTTQFVSNSLNPIDSNLSNKQLGNPNVLTTTPMDISVNSDGDDNRMNDNIILDKRSSIKSKKKQSPNLIHKRRSLRSQTHQTISA